MLPQDSTQAPSGFLRISEAGPSAAVSDPLSRDTAWRAAAPCPPAAAPVSPPPQAWWECCLNFSVFNFASPALESLYQARRAATFSNLSAFCSAVPMLLSACSMLHRVHTARSEQRALLQCPWVNLAVVICACIAHITIILLAPAFAQKRRRAVCAVFLLILTALVKHNRAHVLWVRYVVQDGGPLTFWRSHHSFMLENITVAGVLFGTLTLPISPLADIVLVTGFLAANLRANRSVCELPYMRPPGGLVSLSPTAYAVARGFADGVCGAARAGLGMPCTGLPPACDAVLGFWQVIGWWLTCHIVLAAELAERRAFLRTEQALAHVGPSYRAAALTWPFGRVQKVLEMGLVSALITAFAVGMIAALSTPP